MSPFSSVRIGFVFFFLFLASACGTRKPITKSPSKPESTIKAESNALEKYEKQFGISLPKNFDRGLAETIAPWIGSPYKYGGNTKSGTDCSGFVQQVYLNHYQKAIPRSSEQMMKQSKKLNAEDRREGDLVFFKTGGVKTDHVGIYLTESYFVHASTKRGVIISSLNETYYAKSFLQYGSYR